MLTKEILEREERYSAPIYHPIPVVLEQGKGVWLWDVEGRRYLDMMSSYSAVSCGHTHPRLVKVLQDQSNQLTLVSRAYHTQAFGALLEKLCTLSHMDMGIIMNTGAEAVETALKCARRWGYRIKKIPAQKAEIIVADHNFHGRTTSIISFSSEPTYQEDFGPLTPGFKTVPFGDAHALEAAITPNTCAFLVEPIQGEAGIIMPPKDYLAQVRKLCDKHNVLMILDEVQTGLGRSGKFFAYQHAGIQPDGLILGKALGGGLLPVSTFLSNREVMSLMTYGSHGSTFGGNPLACHVALETLALMEEEDLAGRALELGSWFKAQLENLHSPLIKDIRGVGLFIGLEIDSKRVNARTVCERLMARGVLSKETHETVVRLAPPLIISKEELTLCLDALKHVLADLEKTHP